MRFFQSRIVLLDHWPAEIFEGHVADLPIGRVPSRKNEANSWRNIDSGSSNLANVSNACKARCTATCQLFGKEGIQMHGGIGVTDERDIGLG